MNWLKSWSKAHHLMVSHFFKWTNKENCTTLRKEKKNWSNDRLIFVHGVEWKPIVSIQNFVCNENLPTNVRPQCEKALRLVSLWLWSVQGAWGESASLSSSSRASAAMDTALLPDPKGQSQGHRAASVDRRFLWVKACLYEPTWVHRAD